MVIDAESIIMFGMVIIGREVIKNRSCKLLILKELSIIESGAIDMDEFYTKIAGITFNGRQRFVPYLNVGDHLRVVREPNNEYDSNAIAIYDKHQNQLGYIGKNVAASLAPRMDEGEIVDVTVSNITGGGDYAFGVNIHVCIAEKNHNDDQSKDEIILPPIHLEELSNTDYWNDSNQSFGGITMRRSMADMALFSGKYNMALHLVGGYADTDLKSALIRLQACEKLGDFETAYDIYRKMSNGEYYQTDSSLCSAIGKRYESLGINANIKSLDLPKLNKDDYNASQEKEAFDESYVSVGEALSYMRNYLNQHPNDFNGYIQVLNEMVSNSDRDTVIRGNAYAAELFWMLKDYGEAFKAYLFAARIARNKAIYYGFCGNALKNLIIYNEEDRIYGNLLIASVINQRAIHLDFSNPRWHFYQGLILELLGDFLINNLGEKNSFALDIFTGSLDEYDVALALISPRQESLRRAIVTCRDKHLKYIGDVSIMKRNPS